MPLVFGLWQLREYYCMFDHPEKYFFCIKSFKKRAIWVIFIDLVTFLGSKHWLSTNFDQNFRFQKLTIEKVSFTNVGSLVYSCIQYFFAFAYVFFFSTKCNILCLSVISVADSFRFSVCASCSWRRFFPSLFHFQFNVACLNFF